jgi:dolichol-phosphate mannosyltransferase
MSSQVSATINSNFEKTVRNLSYRTNSSKTFRDNIELNCQIGVLLPTYCEAASIEQLINEIESLKLNISILVIDDSSPDGTMNIVRTLQEKYNNILLIVRPKKSGLGTAITDGFKTFLSFKNPPKYVITMDADYSHNPKDIPRLVKTAAEGYALVIGSRYLPGGETKKWSPIRIMISKAANEFASVAIGARIRDCTSGLRCYSMGLLEKVISELHSQTYEIQIETIRQAIKKGFFIREMPITFINRKLGKSKLSSNEIRQFVSYIAKAKLEDYFEIRRYPHYVDVTALSDEVLINLFYLRTVPEA